MKTKNSNKKGPKILLLDIETSQLLVKVWKLGPQYIGINQLVKDWEIISFAYKWLDEKTVYQMDQRNHSEKFLMRSIRSLLNQCDILVTQNGKSFDAKKINAKLFEHKFKKPKTYQHVDIYREGKKSFNFTSHKLEYMSNKFCEKYTKGKHKKFPGTELWDECELSNPAAWKEMAFYNKVDVLVTEELYWKIIPWGTQVNFNVYYDEMTCSCGSTDFNKNGHNYTPAGKFQRYECKKCGAELKSSVNLLKNLPKGIAR